MMFTRSELKEAELMKFYCNDDILIYKVLLQVSNAFLNNLVKQVRVGFVFPHSVLRPVAGIQVTQLVNGSRN